MTLQELSKYYKLHERLERNREMLSSLYAAAGPGAQVITGMPHAPGVSDKVGNLAAELWELQSKIDYLEQRCAEEKKKLEKYIGAIKDDQTRMIFRLRFIHCMHLISSIILFPFCPRDLRGGSFVNPRRGGSDRSRLPTARRHARR